MKKLLLTSIGLLFTAVCFSQNDSLNAWNAGQAIAHGVKGFTNGTPASTIIWSIADTAAPLIFGWIWHSSHLKNKHRKNISKMNQLYLDKVAELKK